MSECRQSHSERCRAFNQISRKRLCEEDGMALRIDYLESENARLRSKLEIIAVFGDFKMPSSAIMEVKAIAKSALEGEK